MLSYSTAEQAEPKRRDDSHSIGEWRGRCVLQVFRAWGFIGRLGSGEASTTDPLLQSRVLGKQLLQVPWRRRGCQTGLENLR